jgi:hypothetical protein
MVFVHGPICTTRQTEFSFLFLIHQSHYHINITSRYLPSHNNPQNVSPARRIDGSDHRVMRTSRVSSSRCCRLSYNQELIFQMTYFLTAPILYKEAVIGSFESFFHGYDAPLPTNQRSVHRPSNQPRICEMVTRDNEPYRCLQHPIQTPNKIEIADSDWDKFQSPSFISEHCLIWSMLSISSTRLGMRSFCLQLIQ